MGIIWAPLILFYVGVYRVDFNILISNKRAYSCTSRTMKFKIWIFWPNAPRIGFRPDHASRSKRYVPNSIINTPPLPQYARQYHKIYIRIRTSFYFFQRGLLDVSWYSPARIIGFDVETRPAGISPLCCLYLLHLTV